MDEQSSQFLRSVPSQLDGSSCGILVVYVCVSLSLSLSLFVVSLVLKTLHSKLKPVNLSKLGAFLGLRV